MPALIGKISFVIIVRGLFFLTTVDAVNITQSKAIALLWTYPIINFIIVGYVINSRWVYDIWMLRLGGVIGRDLRKMMSRFVFIILVVVIIVYLIYIFNLPRGSLNDWLPNTFLFFAIY